MTVMARAREAESLSTTTEKQSLSKLTHVSLMILKYTTKLAVDIAIAIW